MAVPAADTSLHPLTVGIAVLGAAIGPQAATYVSAYGLIFMGWFAGLLWGTYRREQGRGMPTWAYAVCTALVAIGGTAVVAEWIARTVGVFASTALLFPVAFAVPASFRHWDKLVGWLWDKFQQIRGAR